MKTNEKKKKEKTINQNRSKHSKAGLIAFIENNFKYILAAIAVIIAIIAVFFGESKLIYQQEPVTAHVKFSVINYEITPEVEQGQTPVVEYAYTLAQAVNKAPAGKSTIKVLVGVEETSEVTIPANKEIELDLNGKTTTFNIDPQSEDTSAIVNNGTLRVTDSTQAVNEYNYTMQDGTKPAIGGTLTSNKVALTNNGTGTIDGTAHVQGTGSAINTIINDGDLTIDSGLITSTQNNSPTILNGDSNTTTASLTINGGTVISAQQAVRSNSNLNQESGQTVTAQAVKITGGIFETQKNAIVNTDTSTGLIYITGGDLKGGLGSNLPNPTLYNGGNGKIIIDEAQSATTVITDYSTNCAIYNGGVSGATGTVEIRKGTITSINSPGIRNKQGATLIIGTDEVAAGGTTSVNTTNPTITGNTYGISKESGTFYFYDGSVVGKNGAGSSCNKEPDSIPQDCETQVKLNGTIETLTLNRYAIFDTGENVNIKMKKLVDSSVTARTAADSSIKSIQYYTGTMDDNNKTADNKVSSQDSKADIYM